MSYFISFILIFTVLFVVVMVHEIGHVLAAMIFGVKVKRISFGLGRPILSYTCHRHIEWTWSLWPIGGYVKLLNSRVHPVSKSQHRFCFDKKAFWKKTVILVSGALMNFILAIFAFQIHLMAGYQVLKPIVSQVAENSAAYTAGIRAGDQIIQVDGRVTHSWQEVGLQLIQNLAQNNISLVVINPNKQESSVVMNLDKLAFDGNGLSLFNSLGLTPATASSGVQHIEGLSFEHAFKQAINLFVFLSMFLMTFIKLLLTGYIPFAILLGPIGAINEMLISFYHGLSAFCFFIGYFSLAVGWCNLIPFPGLDGFAVIYAFVEKIRKQPVSIALEVLIQRLAIIAMVVLLIQLLMNDLQRYVS